MNLPDPTTKRITRRHLLRAATGCLGATGASAVWAIAFEPHWLTTSTYLLPLANLPQHWIGRRVVQISDLHVGQVDAEYLKRSMEVVNQLAPDLLLITGDFIDHTSAVDHELESVLKVLNPAKLGTLACLGNHDYGYLWREMNTAEQVTEVANRMGIRILRDDRTEVDGLEIMGVDDYWSPRCNPDSLLRSATPDRPAICLCHNPDTCDRFDWSRFRGIVLSGHTHGGQCKPPFLPPPILPVKNRRYTQGFFELGHGQQLFINRGLGHTHRVRFNCRPEITVFELAMG